LILKKKLGAKPIPLFLPIGAENGYEGNIDLLKMEELRWDMESRGEKFSYSPLSDERNDLAIKWREKNY
jgi:elongation factor G